MKRLICGLLAASVVAVGSGCSLLSDDSIKSALLTYAENAGKENGAEYIDQMVADGKITTDQGEKLKAALAQGVEALKAEIEKENVK